MGRVDEDEFERRFDPGRRQPGDPFDGRIGRTPDRFAPHDLIATVADMGAARRVVQDLQMSGIDASQISLYGPTADEAAADPTVRSADAGFTNLILRRSVIGGAIGAAIGGLVGAVGAGIVLWGLGGDALGVWIAAIIGTAVLGLGTGAATGATSTAQMSRAWELTFHEVAPGEVGVAVHSEDPAEIDRAEAILVRHEPTQLERFDLGSG